MPKPSSRISFVAPKGKREKLDSIAEAFGTNLSTVINDALDNYIELHEWQLAHIQKGVNAARKGEFASDADVKRFFDEHRKPA